MGVLPECMFKQVVMQVHFSSIPGFRGTPLGLRHCRKDSVGIFAILHKLFVDGNHHATDDRAYLCHTHQCAINSQYIQSFSLSY